jgi:hypothetical protein
MTIDKSGTWWKGVDFDDLAECLRLYCADGYQADRIVRSVCTCGHTIFQVDGDRDEGCARRTCTACKAQVFICDSAEIWAKAEPVKLSCTGCRGRRFEIGVAFSDEGRRRHPLDHGRRALCHMRCTRQLRRLVDRLRPDRASTRPGMIASSSRLGLA